MKPHFLAISERDKPSARAAIISLTVSGAISTRSVLPRLGLLKPATCSPDNRTVLCASGPATPIHLRKSGATPDVYEGADAGGLCSNTRPVSDRTTLAGGGGGAAGLGVDVPEVGFTGFGFDGDARKGVRAGLAWCTTVRICCLAHDLSTGRTGRVDMVVRETSDDLKLSWHYEDLLMGLPN